MSDFEKEKIKVLDDVIPKWLHRKAVETIPYLPLKWGPRGLGPTQGYQFFSDQWKHEEIEKAPWVLQAIWMAFEEQKHLIDPDVGDIQLNQIQINLTTKDHIGGLHVDIHDGTEAYTMVYSVCGDSGMDFWSNNPEHINPRIAELSDMATRGEATQEQVEEELNKTKERAKANQGMRTKDATWYEDDFSNHEGEMDSYRWHSVDYKEGRCIVFPSMFIHQGLPPKPVSPRVTIGYIFSGKTSKFARDRGVIYPIFKKEQDKIANRH